jgi:hypothetical protein
MMCGIGCLCLERRGRVAVSEDAELDEDCYVFDHCAEGADEPGEVCKDVVAFLGVEDDLLQISKVFVANNKKRNSSCSSQLFGKMLRRLAD